MKKTIVILLIFVAGCNASAFSRTLHVGLDGQSEYSVIQDAVNAASSGDTIQIGPGYYTEGQEVETQGWTELIWILVNVPELTIIGAGEDETFIGPDEPWDIDQGDPRGIQAGEYFGSYRTVISNISFRNLFSGIHDDGGMDFLEISNCTFSGNRWSISAEPDTFLVSQCSFLSLARDGAHIVTWAIPVAVIEDCEITHQEGSIWSVSGFNFNGNVGVRINRCRFLGGASALTGTDGTRATISNCIFDGQTNIAVYSGIGCEFSISDCLFSNQRIALRTGDSSSTLEVSDTVITEVSRASVRYHESLSGYIRNCILAKGEKYVISTYDGLEGEKSGKSFFDMTNNYWGTDNPDSIQAWIYDGLDDPEIPAIIKWEPYLGQPVGNEKSTLNGLKAFYRGASK